MKKRAEPARQKRAPIRNRIVASARLRDVLRKVKAGTFDESVESAADDLRRYIRSVRSAFKTESEALAARCALCEVYDYKCRFEEAEEILRAQAVDIKADWEEGNIEPNFALLEQQIQIIVHHADCLYRLNKWSEAQALLDLAEKVTVQHLGQSPSRVTLRTIAVEDICGRIAFSRGRLARQQSDYSEAEKLFSKCIDHTFLRFEAATAMYRVSKGRIATEHAYARRTIAIAMTLGLAWMYVNKGQLKMARPLVVAARLLLEITADNLHRAFGAMILGVVERSDAGSNPVRLAAAIRSLTNAHATFVDLKHDRYRAIAAFYLGQLFTSLTTACYAD